MPVAPSSWWIPPNMAFFLLIVWLLGVVCTGGSVEIQRLLTKQASLTAHRARGSGFWGFLLFLLFSVFDLNKGNTHFGFYFGEQKRIKRCFSSALLSSRGSHTVSRGGLPGGCGHPMSLQLSRPLFPPPLREPGWACCLFTALEFPS